MQVLERTQSSSAALIRFPIVAPGRHWRQRPNPVGENQHFQRTMHPLWDMVFMFRCVHPLPHPSSCSLRLLCFCLFPLQQGHVCRGGAVWTQRESLEPQAVMLSLSWQSSIPPHDCASICFSVYLLKSTRVGSRFWIL